MLTGGTATTHQAYECQECGSRTWVPRGVLLDVRLWCADHDEHGHERGARMRPVAGKYVAL